MSRKYQPIWEALKSKRKCTIAAPKPLHKRIIKAVVKEKYQDLGYRFELEELEKSARISYTQKESMLEFKLTLSVGTGDI
jgi:hypothetical protein